MISWSKNEMARDGYIPFDDMGMDRTENLRCVGKNKAAYFIIQK